MAFFTSGELPLKLDESDVGEMGIKEFSVLVVVGISFESKPGGQEDARAAAYNMHTIQYTRKEGTKNKMYHREVYAKTLISKPEWKMPTNIF